MGKRYANDCHPILFRKDDALNINTVQACLRSLIANHSIKVADIVYSGTVLTRSYAPVISRDEYFGNTCTDILGDGQKSALIASLIDTETDLDELEHLEEMIAQRKHILINGGNLNMALSFGPFFTCFIVTLFLTVYLHIIMHHTSVFHKRTITIFVNRYTCYFNPHEYTFQFSFYLFVSVLSGPAKDIRLYNTKYCWLPSTGGYADIFNLVYGRFYPAVAAPGSVYTAAPCALCIFC